MAELNRMEDRLAPEDYLDRTADRTVVQRPLDRGDFDPEAAADPRAANPRFVRSDATNVQNTWDPDGAPASTTGSFAQDGNTVTPLFSQIEVGELRSRWSHIQAEFVDEPRRAVQEADGLVATTMQRLADGFANERASLEKQWDSGTSVSTEDLRLALQRYRAFFGRLLNAA